MRVSPEVREGALIVGAATHDRQQYTRQGKALSSSKVFEGDQIAELYRNHARSHGETIQPQITNTPTLLKGKKTKLKPNKEEKPEPAKPIAVTTDTPEESETPIIRKKEVRNQYTICIKLSKGTLKMDVLDVRFAAHGNAILLVFKDEDSILYTPEAGDVFHATITDKVTKSCTDYRLFSPDIMFTLPYDDARFMVLVIDKEEQ
jgi:hypothetical protein